MTDAQLAQLTQNVSSLAQEVGGFISKEAKDFSKEHVEVKSFNSLVSYVDKESEKRIVQTLRELLPQAGFIAEEGTGEANTEGYNWIVDPLDGTTNFIHGIPVYSISIALAYTQRDATQSTTDLLLGVVHEVNQKECFAAYKGGGATLNGNKITVSPETALQQSLIATGFPYEDFERLHDYLFMMGVMMRNSYGLRRLGSAAVDLAYVAAGRFGGFFEYNLNAWDVAAGALLVKEAGGVVTDFEGNLQSENFIFGRQILAASSVHAQMLSLIKETFLGE